MRRTPHPGVFEAVIGLEIHVQLSTETKLFCACANRFGDPPNTHTCPVCLGMPGALPTFNAEAMGHALRVALALGCRVRHRSRFARKNYFYPDLPKGYQISQYEQPLAEDGSFAFDLDGERRTVGIVRVHLEEDAGKSVHDNAAGSGTGTLIDLNRSGVPLVEIVTSPDLRGPKEADAFLSTLRTTLLYLNVTDASMEEGSLRCDANISVRHAGESALYAKTEIKNLNSFRFLRQALRYEQERQIGLLQAGELPAPGTGLWDEKTGKTVMMREKEEVPDYRYFPEPDLVPVVVEEAELSATASDLPEVPLARMDRFMGRFSLPRADVAVLVEKRARADYFEALVAAGAEPLEASNWIRVRILRWLNEQGLRIVDFPVSAEALAELITTAAAGSVSTATASAVLNRMIETGRRAPQIIADEGLEQICSASDLVPVVDEILHAHPHEVEAYRAGRHQLLGFFMGEVMHATRGQANPELARQLLCSRLEA
ncbi:MAG: Asp-tRNA(Asn)/Glu-tRNA(Gln) amidotransferase subunit GatB [Acidobacteriota bacterium]